ncbi:glycosyl transferase family group 2-domain-containing protein [Mycena albidolilacea]|uniref:Glycosyl transferase family group 2-domain-containing protein n=1 Tax=Mycena albidolilacea TaxID=1033008 RepID=A0AAD7F553_9AGAR|nr:glycosyl transferase family group 2-domain-containing protein [Mycena albidolilacea]
MDYDRWDALLHYLFKQTQGDAWFRPDEPVSSGVALRVSDGTHVGGGSSSGGNTPTGQPSGPEFRVFPYENPALEPFETAVAALNPQVAVKVRSAAVHAALADVSPDDKNIYVDANTRIQILDTMLLLPHADKEQCAAFIRDERVLVVWSESLDAIIPTCQDFEDRLIKLLWRSRPTGPASSNPGSLAGSVFSHSSLPTRPSGPYDPEKPMPVNSSPNARLNPSDENDEKLRTKTKVRRNWYGRKVGVTTTSIAPDVESGLRDRREAKLYAPIYNGLAAGLSFVFIGQGVKTLLMEWSLDGSFMRFILCATTPLLWCVSLFFALQLIQNITMCIGPVAHFHENSKYYSAIKPRSNKAVDEALPHITIQMPVYKESLHTVLAPSIESLKKAMQTYARQGGTSTIFINDDGLRLLSPPDRDERLTYYANHNIGWVARPRHEDAADGFKRAGRFKKASNMNYGLELSLKAERHLETLVARANAQAQQGTPTLAELGGAPFAPALAGGHGHHRMSLASTGDGRSFTGSGMYGIQYQNRDGDDHGIISAAWVALGSGGGDTPMIGEDLEERALGMAIEEMYEESGRRWRPWAANGKATRLGEYVLIVDSDTVVPEDCLRDAAREMSECPTVAILQHESDVMQVAHHYFENGISYFTRRINRCISMACANGEVAPFMGHNAFLRWKAIQDAAFIDPADGKEKIWSETNVSEDFDMALRLLLRGYIIRWATYSNGGFKEGVSLTVDDELNRWQKYAYGCSELLFHPLVQWWRRGPVTAQIHKFLWCKAAPMHYKISMMAYMFSYYGIAASVTIGVINYVLLGFEFPVDGFYIPSFEIWLSCTTVFFGSGTIGYTLLEYRLGHKELLRGFLVNLMWIPFFFFFFGGLGIPVSQAILAHMFSVNISWSATVKEVQRSNFFKEIPKIFKRFWFPLTVAVAIITGMIVCSTTLVPLEWRVTGASWGVIFPLSIVSACHILFPIVLNPWLMVFSY